MARQRGGNCGRSASAIWLSRDALRRGHPCAPDQRTRSCHGSRVGGFTEAIDECGKCLAVLGFGTLVLAPFDKMDQAAPIATVDESTWRARDDSVVRPHQIFPFRDVARRVAL